MKKEKLITFKVNKMEEERIEYLCENLNMNKTQLILYLCDVKYFELINKKIVDNNE